MLVGVFSENYCLKINGIWVFALSLCVLEAVRKSAYMCCLSDTCLRPNIVFLR